MKKRIVTLLLATVMGLSLVGCGAANTATAPETNQTTTDSIENSDNGDADVDAIVDEIVDEIITDDNTGSDETTGEDATVSTEDTTIGNGLLNVFSDVVNSGEATSCLDIAEAVVNSPIIEFGPATMEVEPGYLAGFTEEIDGFDEGAMFGPMIGSIPFVGYVFSVSGDADAFLDKITSVSDPRWNICTEADETVGLVVGDKVCFIMCPSSFDEM